MPYKSEKIKLSEKYDRRIKLTSETKEIIRDEYATGKYSLNDLAKKYNVSKKTILLTVNKESKEKDDLRKKETWQLYRQSKSERAEAQKHTRQYKQKLYIEGKISENE